MILALLIAAATPAAACHPINTDRIYARDLAAVMPAFASLSPGIELGYAPAPGQRRVFNVAELRRLALANHVQADISTDVCFSWSTAVPSRDAMLAAMQETLKGRNAHIEIVDQSLTPAPIGKPEFPVSGLCGFSAEPVIWRGYVTYGENHRFAIWARARVSVKESRVTAIDTLTSGQAVGANQLHVDPYEGPLSRENPITDLKDAIGMIARFDVPAGTVLNKNMLDRPQDVERGDSVKVIVQTEATHIETEGIAEQSGRTGTTIMVRNAKSGRKFRARVEDKDKVMVLPDAVSSLATEESKS